MKVALLLLATVWVSVQETRAGPQLDLPSMPGPPYPDPRGQNRWGVKYDPRKHGPPWDKNKGAIRGSGSIRHMLRHHPTRLRERDSHWSPGRLRPHRRPKSRPRAKSPFYGNRLRRRRPRSYLKAYRDLDKKKKTAARIPSREEEQMFWKSWNAWYQRQKTKSVSAHNSHGQKESTTESPITFYIDLDELENDGDGTIELLDSDDNIDQSWKPKGHKRTESAWKTARKFYADRMRNLLSKAKGLVILEEEQDKGGSKGTSAGMWTTIGKGLDAMRSVRQSVGGPVMKFGSKMALNAVMNVGTSALTSAIKAATFL